MGILDVFWLFVIVAGAAYLFSSSFWKKRGRCHGCADAGCPRRALGVTAALLGCLLLPAASLSAADPAAPTGATGPPAPGEAELYHTPAEKKAAGLAARITRGLAVSGLLEVEASFSGAASELTLATAQLGLGVQVDENVGGTLVLLAEDEGNPVVEEATLDVSAGAWSSRAGLQQLPFGRFRSHFVTDPLTQNLGETKQTALLGGFRTEAFGLSAFVFRGDAGARGEAAGIRDWGASLALTPVAGLEFGAGYLSDLAEGRAGLFDGGDPAPGRRVGGWSTHVTATRNALELTAEVLGAVRRFAGADGRGRPAAWTVELAWDSAPTIEIALRAEGARDLPSAARRRHGAAVSWSPREQLSLSAELLRVTQQAGDEETVVTARLALAF